MNKHRGLIVIVLSFLGVRLLYPILFVPAANFADGEDLVRGTLAHDLLHGGLMVPFWEYLADHYSGGSIVVGLLAVPFFLVFGSTVFALRLVAILFSLAVLLVWYAFVAKNFDSRAALFTALFFVLPPPTYLQGSSLAMGYHTESMFFSAVGFLLLFEMLRRDDGDIRWPAGLGLTLGFGSWFCYTTLVSVAIVFVWWFWHDRRFVARKSFGVFLACFALGFSPWIPANLSHDFRGLAFLGEGLRYHYLRGAPETAWRIVKTVFWCVPTMFDPFQGIRSRAWPVVYAAPFAMSLLYLVVRDRPRADWRASPPADWFFALASIVYVVAVSATRYGLEPYESLYLVPMLPLFFGAAGLSVSRAWRKGRWSQAAALTVFAVPMIGGGLGLARSLDFRWPAASFRMPGYSYGQLADAINLRHPYAPHASLLPRIEQTMTTGERSELLRRLLWPNDYEVKRDEIVARVRRLAAEFPEPARSIGFFQLGIALEPPFGGADASLIARLSQEYPLISDGARLGRVARRFHVPGSPLVNRLPLVLDQDTRILFLDLATHDAPGELGWVRGEEQATFLIESARGMSSVDVRLTNGDRPNSATLASAAGVKSIALAAGQSIVETLDVGPAVSSEGRYYWSISVGSRSGYFPILTRGEPDPRYLGVHVRVCPGSGLQRGCGAAGSASNR